MAIYNEYRIPDFPGGKDKYYEKFIHLILIKAPLYEPFSLYELGNEMNLSEDDKKRYQHLTSDTNFRRVLLDKFYVVQYGSSKFNLTDYGREYRKENNNFTPSELVLETQHWLQKFEKSYSNYNSALEKLSQEKFERNILDDLRLSLELLLKEILNNNKPLEKQIADIGAYQKAKGVSPETTNLLSKLLDHYSIYQNKYAKHDDNVNPKEIEFIFDLTSVFMKFIIKE